MMHDLSGLACRHSSMIGYVDAPPPCIEEGQSSIDWTDFLILEYGSL